MIASNNQAGFTPKERVLANKSLPKSFVEKLTKSWPVRFATCPTTRGERLLLTLPFYALFLVLLAHHAVWRDEINAWAISYVSTSLPDLLHRVHYEAHPALWYLILYAASHVTHAVWGLKLVEAIIGTGIYFVFAWVAPLRRLEFLLVLLGYYFTFEYTVLSRMYGLEVLFAFLYAHFRTRRPDRVFWNTLWLALIANVDITAAILSTGLFIEYALTRMTEAGAKRALRIRELLAAAAFYLAALALSIATLWPAKDIGWSATGKIFSHFWEAGHLEQSVVKWVSIPWLPKAINIDFSWDLTEWPYLFVAPVILVLLYVIFRPHWKQGVPFLAVLLTGILFTQITSVAGIRHTGILYIAFLVMLWIWRSQNEIVSPLAYILLFMVTVPGIIAVIDQASWPYTDEEAAAAWIQQHHLQDMPLFGSEDTDMVGVPERLQRPYYQLNGHVVDTVLTFARRRDAYKAEPDLPASLIRGMREENVSDGLLIITVPLDFAQQTKLKAGGFSWQLLHAFTQGFLGDEYIYLYRVESLPHPSR